MEHHAVTTFYNYVNTLIYNDNITLIAAIRIYLIDNTIPPQHKQMNCIQTCVNVIANRYNEEINIYNNYMENNHINYHVLDNNMVAMIVSIQDVQNMMHNANIQ
jgi:hypothetical protein